MSPKKQATAKAIVGEFDVELMTAAELKMYTEALKEEHERMTQSSNLCQKGKNELVNILTCLQEKILDNKQVAILKNSEIKDFVHITDQKLELKDQLNKIKELEYTSKALRDRLEFFIRIKMAEISHRQEEYELMKDIMERDRDIQSLQYSYDLMTIEMEGSKMSELSEMNKTSSQHLEREMVEYIKTFHEKMETFSQSKIETICKILEESMNFAFAEYLEKMGDYYKEIFQKNIKTIKDLVNTKTKLKGELNVLTLSLRDILKQNERVSLPYDNSDSPGSSGKSSLTSKKTKIQSLKDLTYENYLLSMKLKMLEREYHELKARFQAEVRDIYKKADFKAMILEKKLQSAQDGLLNASPNE